MLLGVVSFVRDSFRWKLALYGMAMVLVATIVYSLFLDYELNTITEFSLEQNTAGTKRMVEDYLTTYADEKALSTYDQIMEAQANLVVLGRTAQKVLDNYDELQNNPDIFDLALFSTQIDEVEGTLSSGPSARYEAFAPPPIADNPRSRGLLIASGLMNLNMDALFESDPNSSFVYFIGDLEAPVTRAYPNIDLPTVLGESVNSLFWKDFFPDNPEAWSRWYTDPDLQARVPSPVTMEAPYEDAAQQGLTLTMFYPLWDNAANQFAGAVGLDITLSNIINNILSVTIGESGFAFLINGQGDVIAMPEVGYELLGLERDTLQRGSLVYSVVSLSNSTNPAVDEMTSTLLNQEKGVFLFTGNLAEGNAAGNNLEQMEDGYLVAFSSLPPFYDSQYQEDTWRIATIVPESETYAVLRETDAAISQERSQISQRSLGLAVGFSLVALVLAVQLSRRVTRDLQTLSAAAGKVSAKEYDVDIQIKSTDEIGQLGHAFSTMTQEIRDYTTNLEEKIARRTMDLQQANTQITMLNEQLKDENLRLSAELEVARHLQMMVLPSNNEMKMVEELDIAGYSRPADEVGGDYYDILRNGEAVFFGIGDVTGHGLPAGVIMLMAQTAMLTLIENGEQDPSRIMTVLNQVLYRNIIRIRDDKSMTMAVLRYSNKTFEISGQHESVLILRPDSTIEEIDTLAMGFPVGLDDDISELISTERFQLISGDVMVLYTDGITEAENAQGDQFGLDRLKMSLSQCLHLDAQEILDHIIRDVYEFIGDTRVYDDISALVVKQK